MKPIQINHWRGLFWVACAAGWAGGVAAYPETPPRNQVDLHFVLQDFTWREKIADSLELEESGLLYGLGVQGRTMVDPAWSIHYRADVYAGTVDYDGFLLYIDGRIEPYESESSYAGVVGDIDVSYLLNPQTPVAFRPFAGLGVRYWLRELDKSEGFGYDEYWTTLYGRLGLRVEQQTGPQTALFMSGALTLPVYNDERVENVPLLPDNDIKLKPGRKSGYQLEAGLRHRHLSVVAFYEALNFGQSDLDRSGMFFQPASEMRLAGLRIGYAF